jgi:hypothetical protein
VVHEDHVLCVMFCGSQLERYFMRAGFSKSVSSVTSSNGYEMSVNIISEGVSLGCSIGSPTVVASNSELGASIRQCKCRNILYQTLVMFTHRFGPQSTPDFMCNQPRKPCRSNPTVQLIIPKRMSVPRGPNVLDFTVLPNASVVCLESDSGPSVSFDEQDETDPNVLQ